MTAKWALLTVAALVIGTMNTDILCAQTKKAQTKARPGPKGAIAKPEDVTLRSQVMPGSPVRIALRCTYYAGPETKETIPIILVHDWGENRGEYHRTAQLMQQQLKLSVIVPDLRGHGSSMNVEGIEKQLDPSKFKSRDMDAMALDIEACKSFLLKKNNEGKLNIEQLGVLGAGFGGSLALKWAVHDWAVRSLPTLKQGQDVKGLIMLSPRRSFRGATISKELKQQLYLRNISALTIVGSENATRMSDAKRIHKAIVQAWGKQSDEGTRLFEVPTSLQGTDLLKPGDIGVEQEIAKFIFYRLKKRGDQFPWMDRTSPLD